MPPGRAGKLGPVPRLPGGQRLLGHAIQVGAPQLQVLLRRLKQLRPPAHVHRELQAAMRHVPQERGLRATPFLSIKPSCNEATKMEPCVLTTPLTTAFSGCPSPACCRCFTSLKESKTQVPRAPNPRARARFQLPTLQGLRPLDLCHSRPAPRTPPHSSLKLPAELLLSCATHISQMALPSCKRHEAVLRRPRPTSSGPQTPRRAHTKCPVPSRVSHTSKRRWQKPAPQRLWR